MNGLCCTSTLTFNLIVLGLSFLGQSTACSMLDSNCFNSSRCSQGFTFYIQPLTHKQHLHYLTTTSRIPDHQASLGQTSKASLHHRCQRVWASNTSHDNLETWAAECLAFVIREYFQVRLSLKTPFRLSKRVVVVCLPACYSLCR